MTAGHEREERVLILIPAFNEETNIGRTIAAVRRVMPDGDILVVDDGSRDATATVARDAGATVLSHHFNMGYGVTIQTGYKYAHDKGYDYLVQLDGDGQHDPSSIPALLAPVRSGATDFALGSRFLGAESYRPPLMRRVGIALFRRLVTVIIGRTITDPTSGYQAFNRDVIRFFTGDLFPCDYPDADMLVLLNLVGFRIVELPVRMYANPEGKSMHSGMKPLYYVFKMCLSILVTLLRQRQPYRR
jgi:glycosyltransferase involved in cell wall biosynthesis